MPMLKSQNLIRMELVEQMELVIASNHLKLMEINIKTIQSAELGTRGLSIDTLCIIGNYYGTTLDYLITGERKDMQKCFSYLSRLSENQRTKIDNIIVNLIDTLEW